MSRTLSEVCNQFWHLNSGKPTPLFWKLHSTVLASLLSNIYHWYWCRAQDQEKIIKRKMIFRNRLRYRFNTSVKFYKSSIATPFRIRFRMRIRIRLGLGLGLRIRIIEVRLGLGFGVHLELLLQICRDHILLTGYCTKTHACSSYLLFAHNV